MCFIENTDVPINRWRDVTYGRVVVYYRLEKRNPYRTQITVGGDRVKNLVYCGTSTLDLTTVKILLNSIVSTPNAEFMTIDVKYFYFNTLMLRSEHMRLYLSNLPNSVLRK